MKSFHAKCHQCGAALEFQSSGQPVICKYCGVHNQISYDFESNVVSLVSNQLEQRKVREELKKRIEIIESNLHSIDPVAKWPPGGPVFSRKALIVSAILAASGFVIIFFTSFGWVPVVVAFLICAVALNNPRIGLPTTWIAP